MSVGLMAVLLFVGAIVFFFLLGRLTPGSGADLVDWDPAGREAGRHIAEQEDFEQQLATVNRRRRAMGLEELGEQDVLEGLRRDRRL